MLGLAYVHSNWASWHWSSPQNSRWPILKADPSQTNHPVRLAYKPYFFSQWTVFFFHNKSVDSTFGYDLSAKRTWQIWLMLVHRTVSVSQTHMQMLCSVPWWCLLQPVIRPSVLSLSPLSLSVWEYHSCLKKWYIIIMVERPTGGLYLINFWYLRLRH